MNRNWLYVICYLAGLVTALAVRERFERKPAVITDTIYRERDSLIYLKDSLINRLDTTNDIINRIDEKFNKDYDIVINQSVDSSYLFFTKYLERQFGSNNKATIEAD